MNKYISEKYLIDLINKYKKYSVNEISCMINNYCIENYSDFFTIAIKISALTENKLIIYNCWIIYNSSSVGFSKTIKKIKKKDRKEYINTILKHSCLMYNEIINFKRINMKPMNMEIILKMLNEYNVNEYSVDVFIDCCLNFDELKLEKALPLEFKNNIKYKSEITPDVDQNYVSISVHN
jgi:hypothetical protein